MLQPSKWNSIHLWLLCLLILIVAIILQKLQVNETTSITLIFSSLLLFAAGSSLLNAIGKEMKKNLIRSVPMFIIHAILSFVIVKMFKPENGEVLMNIYITIVVFYFMITLLSILFRAVYILMSEN